MTGSTASTSIRMLEGRVIGLSLGTPPDIRRLGLADNEPDILTYELVHNILRRGGRILYGGHLEPGGFTLQMFDRVAGAYRPDDTATNKPVLHLLPVSEARKMSLRILAARVAAYSQFVETRIYVAKRNYFSLSATEASTSDGGKEEPDFDLVVREDQNLLGRGTLIRSDAELLAWLPNKAEMSDEAALYIMRIANSELAEARIAIGGNRGDLGSGRPFGGTMPGIYEELLDIDDTPGPLSASKPTIILAAFGGAARDAAIDLGILDESQRTPFLGEMQDGVARARELMREKGATLDPTMRDGLERFSRRFDAEPLAKDIMDWLVEQLGSA